MPLDHCSVWEEDELRLVKCSSEEPNIFRGCISLKLTPTNGQTAGWLVWEWVRMAIQTHLTVLSLWLAFETVNKQGKGCT